MDDSLGGHWASHEADKLELRTIFSDCSNGSVSDLEEIKIKRLEFYSFFLITQNFIQFNFSVLVLYSFTLQN